MPEPLRTLIVDDEPLAIERLQILCASLPDLALVGTASDGEAALRLVEALQPELVFLDIAMPGLTGLDVARAIEGSHGPPAIVFVTAFDRFAVEAFEVAAVDYLLKPVSADRLARTLERVRSHRALPPDAASWTQEFWVPQRGEMIRIAASDIDLIEAERDYMRLHWGARSFLIHQTISALEARLDPCLFVRLHRSTIVRKDGIARFRHDGSGRWEAELSGGRIVRIGRSYQERARALMT